MNSSRLNLLAELIDKSARVLDVGTDHAYLPILLYQKGVRKILASDIHENALNQAKKSLKEYELEQVIPLVLSDGLNEIETNEYDTLVLAGMGSTTITTILSNAEKIRPIKTIYVQSNNDYFLLRKFMNQHHWILEEEYLLEEKKQIYHIMKYVKGRERLTNLELMYGKYQKKYQSFYRKKYDYLKKILDQIPENHYAKRKALTEKLDMLNSYIKKIS